MSERLQETNFEEIIRELTAQRGQEQRPILFLGSRVGGLYGNESLYETLKRYSLLNFDGLSSTEKFKECYFVLSKHFKAKEIYKILVDALTPLTYREEDIMLAELIREGFFETIITTNIDSLLEKACSIWRNDFQLFVPAIEGVQVMEQHQSGHNSIIKVFGDLEAGQYYTAGNSLKLKEHEELRKFLESRLKKEVTIVGYDPVWDRAIESAFPLHGGTLRFINEAETFQENDLIPAFKQRNGKLLLNRMGSYSNFIKILYQSLTDEVYRNEIAAEPLPSLIHPLAKNKKKVFISYSRKDRKYLDRLKIHLEGYLYQLKDTVALWDDTSISPGRDWKEEITKALKQAEVAILLISANYLSSQSVSTYELPLVLEAASEGNVELLPIFLDPSLPSFNERELNSYQTVNSISNPLERMKPYDREVLWKTLAERVYNILR